MPCKPLGLAISGIQAVKLTTVDSIEACSPQAGFECFFHSPLCQRNFCRQIRFLFKAQLKVFSSERNSFVVKSCR